MISAIVTAQVWAEAIRRAFREEWRRMLLGAFAGWALTTVVGAFVLAYWADEIAYSTSNVIGGAIVYAGVALGGVCGYASRDRGR